MPESHDPYDALEQVLAAMFGPTVAADAVHGLRQAGVDPSAIASASGLGDLGALSGPQMMALQAQLGQMMAQAAASSASGESVNWTMGEQMARRVSASSGDPTVTAALAEQTASALQVADLWLDVVTDLGPAPGPRQAWGRTDWVDRTMPTWKQVCAPVAQAVTNALSDALTHQLDRLGPLTGSDQEPGEGSPSTEQASLGAALPGIMRTIAGTTFGLQLGQAIGQLGVEAVSATDVGLPLVAGGGTALVPAGVAAFATDLDAPEEEVRLFLAVREAAAARLYAHVPWLRPQILTLLERYAAQIRIDTEAIEAAVTQVDPSDPEALRAAMESGIFQPQATQAQRQALEHVETTLALVEGWVETVTARATAAHLPHAVALGEMWRRRRLAGSGAEQVFARLIGMEFRPRRVREAARLWSILEQQAGVAERDALWHHPDVMPSPTELAHPEDFLTLRQAAADLDAQIDADLASLLDGTLGYAEGMDQEDAGGRDEPDSPGANA